MKKGFTLIEMLVVIAIAGMLAVISFSSYSSIRKVRDVQVTAQRVSDLLSQARADAISPKNSGVTAVSITYTSGILSAKENDSSSTLVAKLTLPTGVSLVGFSSISFDYTGLITTQKSFNVQNASGTIKYLVTVYQNGSVNVTKI